MEQTHGHRVDLAGRSRVDGVERRAARSRARRRRGDRRPRTGARGGRAAPADRRRGRRATGAPDARSRSRRRSRVVATSATRRPAPLRAARWSPRSCRARATSAARAGRHRRGDRVAHGRCRIVGSGRTLTIRAVVGHQVGERAPGVDPDASWRPASHRASCRDGCSDACSVSVRRPAGSLAPRRRALGDRLAIGVLQRRRRASGRWRR